MQIMKIIESFDDTSDTFAEIQDREQLRYGRFDKGGVHNSKR
jgi:hypothetical protein